jgi:hypothetical protein
VIRGVAHTILAVYCGASPTEGATMSERKPNDPEIPELPQRETKDAVKGGGAYVGETEKNLDFLLANAKRTNASLSFTESDSLFKR